jgi:hypothetical protein
VAPAQVVQRVEEPGWLALPVALRPRLLQELIKKFLPISRNFRLTPSRETPFPLGLVVAISRSFFQAQPPRRQSGLALPFISTVPCRFAAE